MIWAYYSLERWGIAVNNQLKDSKTKVNLMKAFAGESQARNRYTFAAEAARLQKMYAIANVFEFVLNGLFGENEYFAPRVSEIPPINVFSKLLNLE